MVLKLVFYKNSCAFVQIYMTICVLNEYVYIFTEDQEVIYLDGLYVWHDRVTDTDLIRTLMIV